jgi:hypothetical protein
LALLAAACGGGEDEKKAEEGGDNLVKSGVSAVVAGAVSTTKDVVSGVAEGIDEGRKSGESLDGALVVTTDKEFADNLTAEILRVYELEKGSWQVTVALRNPQSVPVRLTFLELAKAVLLDTDGFSYQLAGHSEPKGDVTVLPAAATRVRLVFDKLELPPAKLRFYGVEYPLPAPTPAEPPADSGTPAESGTGPEDESGSPAETGSGTEAEAESGS